MSRSHIGHKEIAAFAVDKVNLSPEKAQEHRKQVAGLQERLERHIEEHPDFTLRRMMLSGSLAKGLALRNINDIDVAVYISGSSAPHDLRALLNYLAERLRTAYPNISKDQVTPETYSVKISFKGSGLDVDVVPILYYGDPDWRGDLISHHDGSFLETSIPLHLQFTQKRKGANKVHFAQVVRLAKYWARLRKAESDDFRFKSFMIELIFAHLADTGTDLSDYPEALQAFFTYIIKTGMRERLVFPDYYKVSEATVGRNDLVQIIDPVNKNNNVGSRYSAQNTAAIVAAASDAGDAIDWALSAPTKQDTVEAWRSVFGSAFQG